MHHGYQLKSNYPLFVNKLHIIGIYGSSEETPLFIPLISSILDNIDGIGEVRKKKILKKYKTIDKMRDATIGELKEIMPEVVAINFHEYLRKI